MSSIANREELDPADLAMIRDVLRTEGFSGLDAQKSSDAKRAASDFLQTEFHNGNRTRESLLIAIRRKQRSHPERSAGDGLPMTEGLKRWQDEGGQ